MKANILLSCIIFSLVLISALAGLFYQTPGGRIEFTTPRGEHATLQGSGVYKYDPVEMVREGKVWDALDLVLGLPLLVLGIYLTARGSLRGQVLLAGMLFFYFYKFLMAATGNSFNPLFLLYVSVFALSSVALGLTLLEIDLKKLNASISKKFPRGWFIGFCVAMSAVLLFLWIGGRIIPYTVAGRFPDEFGGLTTLETQALDLGLVVPLLLTTAILLWKKSPLATLFTGISITFGLMMSVSIPAWIAVPMIQDGKINIIEAAPFTILCFEGLAFVVLYYRNLDAKAAH